MALSHGQPYTGAEGNVPGFAGAGQLAQELTQQACQGTDPPLAMHLPHTKAMQSRKGVQTPPFQSLSKCYINRMSVNSQSPAPPLPPQSALLRVCMVTRAPFVQARGAGSASLCHALPEMPSR